MMGLRKIPGNLNLDDLLKLQDGFVPKVKIHLQELLEGGRAGRVFRELTHWTQVSINRQLGGRGRATISLANVQDRHFDNRAARVFTPEKKAVTQGYLRDLHRRVLPHVNTINPARRNYEARDFQGARTFTEEDVTRYVEFLYNFDGWDGGLRRSQAGGKPDLPALGLLQRVIIDAEGPDGRWYALFTGFVSSIEDTYRAGEIPMIDLVCSDYWRLFDLSELVVRTGVDPIADNFQFSLLGRIAEASPKSNAWADMTAAKIIHTLMDVVQRTMCWIPYALWKNNAAFPDGLKTSLPAAPEQTFAIDVSDIEKQVSKAASIGRKDFFNEDPFWYVPFSDQASVSETYDGHNTLRHYATALPQQVGGSAITRQDGDEPYDGMPVAQLYSTLLVDKHISSGVQGEVYALFIKAILQPWETNRTAGSTIIRRVAEATFYDVTVTSNGDVLYQIPKYNNCPGEYRPSGPLSSPSGIPSKGVAYDSSNWADGDFDYAPAPEGFAQRHHGFNYAIADLGLRGWRLSSSEEGLVTTVRVPFGQQQVELKGNIEAKFVTGRTSPEATRDLIARFGLRAFEAQKMSVKDIYTNPARQELIDRFAQALLNQINGRAFGGSLDLSFRPDLDVGKNVFLIEKQRLFYVIGATSVIRLPNDASTTLQLAFGHDITREIVSPFASVRDLSALPSGLVTTSSGASAPSLSTQQPTPATSASDAATSASGSSVPRLSLPSATTSAPATQSSLYYIPRGAYETPGFKALQAQLAGAPKFALTSSSGFRIQVNKNVSYINRTLEQLLSEAIATAQTTLGASVAITLDEYTLARIIQSETGDTSALIEQVLVAQTEKSEAARKGISITRLVTYGSKTFNAAYPQLVGRYGTQYGRQAATSQDPTYRALLVARAVLNGTVPDLFGKPGLCNFISLRGTRSQAGASPARQTLNRWANPANKKAHAVWVGDIDGITLPGRHLFFRWGFNLAPSIRRDAWNALDNIMKKYGF